jgi:hypothetical protein
MKDVVRPFYFAGFGGGHEQSLLQGVRWADFYPEVEFYGEIPTKVLKVCLLAIHSHLYCFALRFLVFKLLQPLSYFFKLIQPLTYFYSSVTLHCQGERRKT